MFCVLFSWYRIIKVRIYAHMACAACVSRVCCSNKSKNTVESLFSARPQGRFHGKNFRRCKGTDFYKQKPPTQWVRVGGTDFYIALIISAVYFSILLEISRTFFVLMLYYSHCACFCGSKAPQIISTYYQCPVFLPTYPLTKQPPDAIW